MLKNEFVVCSVWIILLVIILCIVTIATGCNSPNIISSESVRVDTVFVAESVEYLNGFEVAVSYDWIYFDGWELWFFVKTKNISGDTLKNKKAYITLWYDTNWILPAYKENNVFTSSQPVEPDYEYLDTVKVIQDSSIVWSLIKFKDVDWQNYFWSVNINNQN